jgi:diacylglycerol kinase family enzyme
VSDTAPSGFLVLVNAASGPPTAGGRDARAAIAAACRRHALQAEVRAVEPGGIEAAARAALGRYAAVVIAGGDGSVGAAAAAVAGSDTPLGVLPLGTLNHFAFDLGLPADLDAAVGVLAQRHVRRVDVAEVNGRLFVNNSAVGIYTAIVQDRDRQRRERGRGKWAAMALAALRALPRYRRQRLTIVADGRRWEHRSSLVFVGNNDYALRFPHLAARARLDGGTLCLFAIDGRGWRLLRLAALTLAGRADADRDFRRLDGVRAIEIGSRLDRLTVALDGEVTEIETPLRYRPRPGALAVLAPG